ncbi:hypothetical protein [Pontibacter actiniarum]|uniref:Uncharacterized protein n=1 Tax=Pontibacter actiniarum TaxID=323450 RepID=A0A1X9YPL2_9BACT|nr:hypothetical protein [Pontibacter actiniarum]ARS34820.1 hypothetical protein CA264_04840 [Pontibacter actiniarum]
MKQTLRTPQKAQPSPTKATSKANLSYRLSGESLLRGLYWCAAALVVLNVIAIVCKYTTGHPNAWGIIPQFELDAERNVPTYFSSFILLLSSLLLFAVSLLKQREQDKFTWQWRLLSVVFLYLSVDESAGLHEMFIYPLRDNFHLTGILYFSWVIVGAGVVIALGAYYLPFLLSLHSKLRFRVMLAAVVYVGGALGVELYGGYYADAFGLDNLGYALITTVEETMEITGVLLLLHALYKHLKQQLASVTLVLSPVAAPSRQPAALVPEAGLAYHNHHTVITN